MFNHSVGQVQTDLKANGNPVDDNAFVSTNYEAKFIFITCSAFINYLKGKFGEEFNHK